MQKSLRHIGLILGFTTGAIGLAACSGDDTAPPGSGGSGGTEAGTGGRDASGDVATGDAHADAEASTPDATVTDVVLDCGTPGVIHTPPTVPSSIAAPSGVTLVGGYRGSGNQIYACTATPSDGGADAAPAGTWVNTATATLYGDNCSIAVQHTFTSTPAPMWTLVADGSSVVGARINAVPAPVSDAGDGGATAITWLLLRAASNSGEGIFTSVTYIQRVDTVGGVGPAGPCDPTVDAGRVVTSPYSATYYFYTGTAADAGPDAPPIEASIEASIEARVEASVEASIEAAPIESGIDAPLPDSGPDVLPTLDAGDGGDGGTPEAETGEPGTLDVITDAGGEG